jgi:2-polyprenyl-3-methyl-5-hydroxy-6-metoxy-1,4-benzoquinol methylase
LTNAVRNSEIMKQIQYTCEICSTTDYTFCRYFTKRLVKDGKPVFQVIKCKKCGLHSLHPIPSERDLSWIYKNYFVSGNRLSVEKNRIHSVYPKKIEKIKNYYKNPKILDIGSGLGGFCYVGKTQGLNVLGIEMDTEQVKIAKKEFDIELMNMSIQNFFLHNTQMFDVVHLHHVLEHLQHPKDVLLKVQEILTPEGIVLFEVPNQFFVFREEMKIFLKIKIPKAPYNPYHHIYFFSPITLNHLIDASGYKPLEIIQVVDNPKSYKVKLHKILANITNMGFSWRIEAIIKKK